MLSMTRVRNPLSDLRQRRATAIRIMAQFELAVYQPDQYDVDEAMGVAEKQTAELLTTVKRLDREIAAMVRRDA
jgi:hypothetical protein